MIEVILEKIYNRVMFGSKKERKRRNEFDRKFNLGMELLKDDVISEEQLKRYLINDKTNEIVLPCGYIVRSVGDYFKYKIDNF